MASRRLTPFMPGHLDRLDGCYALVNGTRRVLGDGRLTDEAYRFLFIEMLIELQRSGELLTVLVYGMPLGTVKRMATVAASYANANLGPITIDWHDARAGEQLHLLQSELNAQISDQRTATIVAAAADYPSWLLAERPIDIRRGLHQLPSALLIRRSQPADIRA